MSDDPCRDVDAREAEQLPKRLHYCRTMLYLHGYMSEKENENVKRRLGKDYRLAATTQGEDTPNG